MEKLSEYSQLIVFIGGLLALFGAYLSNVQSDLKDKNNESVLSSLTETVTGGDSFCVVDLLIFGNDPERKPNFYVYIKGNIPLKNVEIKIEDYAKSELEIKASGIIDPSSMKIQEILKNNEYRFLYPAIYPGSKFSNIKLSVLPNQKDLIYFITINSDNGQLKEEIKVEDYKSLNYKYSIVISKNGENVIKTNVPITMMDLIN